jgi:TM2 domain-containing membrane protein YozV
MEEKVVVKKPPKSPFLAGILAFFFPFGVGQLYNKQSRKAFVFFFIFAGLVTLQTTGDGQPFLGLLLAGFYIYQIFDAVQTSNLINRRILQGEEEISEAEEVPDFVKTGSIFWGVILIALGFVLLLANFEVMDYDTVFEFLIPFTVLAVGVKLIVDYYTKNGKQKE